MAKSPTSVIVIAPQGAGKTFNSKLIAKAFGCTSILDDWDGKKRLQPGTLALTNLSPFDLALASEPNAPKRKARP